MLLIRSIVNRVYQKLDFKTKTKSRSAEGARLAHLPLYGKSVREVERDLGRNYERYIRYIRVFKKIQLVNCYYIHSSFYSPKLKLQSHIILIIRKLHTDKIKQSLTI